MFDIEDLPPIAIKLVRAGVSRKEALRIANQEWDAVDPAALPEDSKDFACLCRKKNRARTTRHKRQKCGWVHRQSHPRKLSKPRVPKTTSGGKSGRKTSDACLTEGRDARKAERTHPTSRAAPIPNCLDQAASKITSSFVRDRLIEYDSINDAYGAGGMIAGEINSILAKEHCADLIALVIATYEDEKARILGKVG